MPGEQYTIYAIPSKQDKGLCIPGSAELISGLPWGTNAPKGKVAVYTTAVGSCRKSNQEGILCGVLGGSILEYEIEPGKQAHGFQEGRMAMRIIKEKQLPLADHHRLMQVTMRNCLYLLEKYYPDALKQLTHVTNTPSQKDCATDAAEALTALVHKELIKDQTYKISNILVSRKIKDPTFYQLFPWSKPSKYSHEQLIKLAVDATQSFLETKLTFEEHAYCAFQKLAHKKQRYPNKPFSRQEVEISPKFRDMPDLEIFQSRPGLKHLLEKQEVHAIGTDDDTRSSWSMYEHGRLFKPTAAHKHTYIHACCVDGRAGAAKGATKLLKKHIATLHCKAPILKSTTKKATPKPNKTAKYPSTLEDLKSILHQNNVRTHNEYFERYKEIGNLPVTPANYYKDWDTWACVLQSNLPRSLWAAGWSENLEKYAANPNTPDGRAWLQLQQERLNLGKLDTERETRLLAKFPHLQ